MHIAVDKKSPDMKIRGWLYEGGILVLTDHRDASMVILIDHRGTTYAEAADYPMENAKSILYADDTITLTL